MAWNGLYVPASAFKRIFQKKLGGNATGGIILTMQQNSMSMKPAVYVGNFKKCYSTSKPFSQNYQKNKAISNMELLLFNRMRNELQENGKKWSKTKMINPEISNHNIPSLGRFHFGQCPNKNGTACWKVSFLRFYIDEDISLHFLSPEPSQYVDISTPIIMIGDIPLENVFGWRPSAIVSTTWTI